MAPDELVKRYARAYKDAALIASLGTWIWYATVAILITQFWPVVRRGTGGLDGLSLVFILMGMFPLAVAGFAAGMLIRKLGSLALGRASEGGTDGEESCYSAEIQYR